MLISNKHNFIFLHVAKNAGQSISNALFPYSVGPFRRGLNPVFPYRYQLKVNSALRRFCGIRLPPQSFHDHATAREIIGVYGRDKFESYFSFAVVRNPWDWQVSQFQYALTNPRHQFHRRAVDLGDFKNYVEWRNGGGRVITQADFLKDDSNQLAVSRVCRYERLAADFADVCQHLSIGAGLPSFNKTKSRKPYWTYYDDRMVEIIGRLYQEDVEMFGYQFREGEKD